MRTLLASLVLPTLVAAQVQVTLGARQDNTLYQSATGALSNGAGQRMFTGTNSTSQVRRGLVAFDVAAAVPAGSQILGATLTLNLSQLATAAGTTVGVHAVTAAWGEGTSVAAGNEGAGAAATTGDATWLHRSFNTTLWTAVGGDFVATPSAMSFVQTIGPVAWTSAQLAADVQGWLLQPASNFGWMLRGDETTPTTSARFDTRENTVVAARPQLTLVYAPPAAVTVVGAPCQGLGLGAAGLPQVGNAAFALDVTGGTPGHFAVLWLTPALLAAPLPFGNGCLLHVDLLLQLAVWSNPLDPLGGAHFGLPVPADQTLQGAVAHTQAIAIDITQLTQPVGTNALSLRLGQ